MYRLNLTYRNVLITADEVIARTPTSHTIDPEKVQHAIEIAEERFIVPVLGANFYDALAEEKNQHVTASNKAALQAEIDAAFAGTQPYELQEGDIVNAAEFLSQPNRNLWNGYLWKLTAECVRFTAIPEAYAQFTSSGIMKPNTSTGSIGMSEAGKGVGVDLRDAKWLVDKWLQDRIDPLIESLKRYLCRNRGVYSLYAGACYDCGEETGHSRKTAWVLGIYDDDDDDRGRCCD